MRAGHFPTKHFDLSAWQAMPAWQPEHDWEYPPEGFSRFKMNGRPMVGYRAPFDSGEPSFAVRPIVRVPMGRSA